MKKLQFLLLLATSIAAQGQINIIGIGMLYKAKASDGYAVVQQVLINSPAADAGIQAGEVMWAVDGKTTKGVEATILASMLKGTEGSTHKLTIGQNKRDVNVKLRRIKGKCTDGDCKNGEGRVEEPNGSIYRGNFTNGQFQGYGMYYWYEGEHMSRRYEGYFEKGKTEGAGKMNYYDYDFVYDGNFKQDMMEGKGVVTFGDGTKFKGNFSKNEPVGAGTIIAKNGEEKTIQVSNWATLYEMATGKSFAKSNSSNTATTQPKTTSKTNTSNAGGNANRNSNGGGSGIQRRANLSAVAEKMKQVESKLYNAIDAYPPFREAYRKGLLDVNEDNAARVSKTAFENMINNYIDMLKRGDELKALANSEDPDTWTESQYESWQGWVQNIGKITESFNRGIEGESLSPSKLYWANLNIDLLHEYLDKARAYRVGL